ncbi:MAG: hypothetical protein HQK71_05560 [Desulfamplus sp.]|nr:hypothetical protein [Desulfamplus sp.]
MSPGGEGKISIKVNTRGYGGRKLHQSITVLTNDNTKPSSTLTVSGDVEKFVTITPPVIRFNGKVGEELKSVVNVVPEAKFPFEVLKIRAQEGKNIKYELKEDKSDAAKKSYSITVENLKKEPGFYYDVIILETDSKIQPEIKINVMARLIDPNTQANPPLQGLTPTPLNNGAQIPFPVQSRAVDEGASLPQDNKKSEELKKKFEALIKQAQEKQQAQEAQQQQNTKKE